MNMEDEFLIEIREDFLAEAQEMIEKAETCFLDFEKNSTDSTIIEEILRLFHSLKGSSFAVGFNDLANFSHKAEDYIIAIRDKVIPINDDANDTLLLSSDIIKNALNLLQSNEDDSGCYADGLAKIESAYGSKPEVKEEVVNDSSSTDEISDEEALALLKEMEAPTNDNKVESPTPVIEKLKNEITETATKAVPVKKVKKKTEESIKIGLSKIDTILDSFGEQLIWQKKLSFLFDDGMDKNRDEILTTIANLDKITLDLQQTAVTLRMVDLKTTFGRLERVVRETSKSLDKKVNFVKIGEDSELDKNIVDSLIDPLTHMVRNAMDHGLESNEERLKIGKPEVGVVQLKAYRQGGFFYIEISDDGKGLDKEVILNKAIEKGLVGPHEKLTDNQIYNILFRNGFSTKAQATDVSGRGVGMDVVKQMFENLKGTCEIQSQLGTGSTFKIRLPLALAMFQGVVLSVENKQFIMPNSDYLETGEVSLDKIYELNSREKVIEYKDEVMPVISLRETFKLNKNEKQDKCLGAVIPCDDRNYLMLFDDLISQERIVLKKLMPNVEKINGIVGGTILGDGKVALVLEMKEIINNHKRAG